MSFDYRELDNRLGSAGAELHCLSCGSDHVHFAGRAVALIEVGDEGTLERRGGGPSAQGVFCAARICNACGFVHLYSLVAVDRATKPS